MAINDQLGKFDPQLEALTSRLGAHWKTLMDGHYIGDHSLQVGDSNDGTLMAGFNSFYRISQ